MKIEGLQTNFAALKLMIFFITVKEVRAASKSTKNSKSAGLCKKKTLNAKNQQEDGDQTVIIAYFQEEGKQLRISLLQRKNTTINQGKKIQEISAVQVGTSG